MLSIVLPCIQPASVARFIVDRPSHIRSPLAPLVPIPTSIVAVSLGSFAPIASGASVAAVAPGLAPPRRIFRARSRSPRSRVRVRSQHNHHAASVSGIGSSISGASGAAEGARSKMAMPTLGPRRASNISTGSGSHNLHGSSSHHSHGHASTSARSSPALSPSVYASHSHSSTPSHLPPPSAAMSASTASVDLHRNASTSSQRSALSRNNSRGRGMIPSPRLSAVALSRSSENGSASASAPSSNSGSRNSSFIGSHTPRLLTRRSSEKQYYGAGVMAGLLRSGSGRKGKDKERTGDELATANSANFSASDSQEM